MRVREIMSEPVETVLPATPLANAAALMKRRRCHHLIVKESGRIVGILSAADVGRALTEPTNQSRRVSDVMSPHVATIEDSETVRRAANMMQGRSIGCLAVMHGGKLAGIVTVSDLLRLLGKGADRRPASERASLHYRVAHHGHRAREW